MVIPCLFVQGIEQFVRDADRAEAGHQNRRSVANPGYRLGCGLHLLVDHVRELP
jgi:hypothetical protein